MVTASSNSPSSKRARSSKHTKNTSFPARSPTFSSLTHVSEPDSIYSPTTSNSNATLLSLFQSYPTSSDPFQLLLPCSVFGAGNGLSPSQPLAQATHSVPPSHNNSYKKSIQTRKATQLAPRVQSMQVSTLDSQHMIPEIPLPVAPEVTKPKRGKKGKQTPGRRISANSTLRCEICNQMYSRKDNLRAHQRVHNGERPYKCQQCGESFRWLGALRTHQATHQQECDRNAGAEMACEKTYDSKEEQRRKPQTGFPEVRATKQELPKRKSPSRCSVPKNETAAKSFVQDKSRTPRECTSENLDIATLAEKVQFSPAEPDKNREASLVESKSLEEILLLEKCEEFVLNDNFLLETLLLPELSSDWLPIQAA